VAASASRFPAAIEAFTVGTQLNGGMPCFAGANHRICPKHQADRAADEQSGHYEMGGYFF